ncbi:MAG: oligosaccharide flippase family protein [Caldibacillus thermoamylovorans]
MLKIFFRNFSWNFLGSSIYSLTQWVLILIITKIGGPKDVGIYSLGLAISSPLIMLINLNFRALQSTSLSLEFGFNGFKRIRKTGILFFLFIYTIILSILKYDFEITITLLIIAFCKMIESYSELFFGLFQYNERLDLEGKSNIFRGVIGTLGFGIVYYFFEILSVALLFMLFVWLLNLLFINYKLSKKFIKNSQKHIDWIKLLTLVKIGLPLGIISFLASLNVNIPRIVYESYLTLEDLGYFTPIFYLVLIIGKFMTSISNTVLPRLARLYENNKKDSFIKIFKFIIALLLIFSTLIILVSCFFGSELLFFIYGEEYSNLNVLLVLIMIYGLFNYLGSLFETGLNAMKAYKFRLYIEIFITIAIIIGSIYFIPIYGLNGGAIALIISAIAKSFLLFILFIKRF